MKWTLAPVLAVFVGLASGCESPPPTPRAPKVPTAFAFGVIGDAPYRTMDVTRYRQALGEINASDVALVLHVGDLLSGPCDDAVIAARAAEMQALRPAVVYTPGDNEWTDCHRSSAGDYQPLERLAFVRRTFFADPARSLGTASIPVETQSADTAWAEAVENQRWKIGKVVFATLHLVGSGNGGAKFKGRTAADDRASARRLDAALAWMAQTYSLADSLGAPTVVLAFHANIGFGSRDGIRDGYESFVPALRRHAAAFAGRTLMIHGDTHDFHYDQALTDSTGAPLPRAWRLETWGSPRVGWVRVVVDSVSGDILQVDSRRSQLLGIY